VAVALVGVLVYAVAVLGPVAVNRWW